MTTPRILGIAAVAGVLLLGGMGVAHADPHGRGHDRDHWERLPQTGWRTPERDTRVVIIKDERDRYDRDDRYDHDRRFDGRERAAIRNYMRDRYCRPGSCVYPPRPYTPPFRVGEVLVMPYQPIWLDLARLLLPAPEGTRYVRVNSDVFLIDRHHRVLDVVTLFD